MQDPGKVLVKAGVGSLRSSAFLGVFVALYESKSISLLLLSLGSNSCLFLYSYILL